jgi:putative PIN family toxin of toxin-antitoxin system
VKRIILDTNVLISGIFWKGKTSRLLESVIKHKVELVASYEMLKEYTAVINRIAEKYNEQELGERWAVMLIEHLTLIDAPKKFKKCRDPYDNMFVDCALASGAKIIVTGDDDLLSLDGTVKGISFLTVDKALTALK